MGVGMRMAKMRVGDGDGGRDDAAAGGVGDTGMDGQGRMMWES